MIRFLVFLIVSTIAFLLIAGNVTIDLSGNRNEGYQVDNNIGDAPKYSCKRKNKYENLPEFERALSLIEQRETEYLGKGDWKTDIYNCVFIKYADARNYYNAEGYFVFDATNANEDYLPIYIDYSYKITDDLLTATLIQHELTHARQFIRTLNGVEKESGNCYSKEVQAYFMQASFTYFMLNREESDSLFARMDQYNAHPQLRLLSLLFDYIIEADQICESYTKEGTKCFLANIIKKIDRMVRAHPVYQKQCSNDQ